MLQSTARKVSQNETLAPCLDIGSFRLTSQIRAASAPSRVRATGARARPARASVGRDRIGSNRGRCRAWGVPLLSFFPPSGMDSDVTPLRISRYRLTNTRSIQMTLKRYLHIVLDWFDIVIDPLETSAGMVCL